MCSPPQVQVNIPIPPTQCMCTYLHPLHTCMCTHLHPHMCVYTPHPLHACAPPPVRMCIPYPHMCMSTFLQENTDGVKFKKYSFSV